MQAVLRCLVVVGSVFVCAGVLADATPVPIASAAADAGTSSQVPIATLGNPRTFQLGMSKAVLAASGIAPGSQIVAMSYRLDADGGGAYPGATINYSQYDVQLSTPALAVGSLSSTFATNVGADAVTVRSGSFFLGTNILPGGATAPTPNAFSGVLIKFTTPFVYLGGDLLVTVRHSGGDSAAAESLDAAPSGSGLQFNFASGAAAATATTTNAACPVVQFDFVPPVQITKAFAPVANADVEGPINYGGLTVAGVPQVTQLVIGAAELRDVPRGSRLTGLSWRLDQQQGTSDKPASSGAYSQFDIQLSRSQHGVGSMSAVIADNQGADTTTVRSGALQISAGAFPGGAPAGSTNRFGAVIPFTTPYVYSGGDLHVLIRSSVPSVALASLDAVHAGGTGVQCGFAVGSASATSTNTVSTCPVLRFSVDASPVSSTAAVETAGGGGQGFWTGPSPGSTYQAVIGVEELGGMKPGTTIDGFTWRLNPTGQASWPPSGNASFGDFTVQISTAATGPGGMSSTFANNNGADLITVRTGALVVPTGAFPGGATAPDANAFGMFIPFSTPFVYKGGDVCLTVRHSGRTGGTTTTGDAVTTSGGAGYNTRFQAKFNSSAAATTGTTSNYLIVRLSTTPSVCVPTEFATAEAPSLNVNLFEAGARTVQVLFDPIQLADVPPGSLITGMSLRKAAQTLNQPLRVSPFSSYAVQLSSSPNTPSTMSATFASNIGADVITVREGALAVPTFGFYGTQTSPTPNPNWFYISFDRPYHYQGGALCVTVRHSGTGLDGFVCDSTDVATSDYNCQAAKLSTATVGSAADIPIIRFSYSPFRCRADFDGNGFVNGDDADAFASEFFIGTPFADYDGNGFVNGDDADAFAVDFFAGC